MIHEGYWYNYSLLNAKRISWFYKLREKCVLWVFLSNLVHPEATGSALAVTNINIHSVTSFGLKGQKLCWESHSSQLKTAAHLLHM